MATLRQGLALSSWMLTATGCRQEYRAVSAGARTRTELFRWRSGLVGLVQLNPIIILDQCLRRIDVKMGIVQECPASSGDPESDDRDPDSQCAVCKQCGWLRLCCSACPACASCPSRLHLPAGLPVDVATEVVQELEYVLHKDVAVPGAQESLPTAR